ncbi:DUF1415 domain-containing protein [Thiocapsa bogorovii]|uniref:DUF1415 domain-containing protein n=1 Tax=Thiocapsa bogorovii TaxID=521689 RepID=UPI001E35878B|nr:DUF1415 domain-containing protein [Thiocapsa bogorovii]UHD17026.1 DUF1415 domain-containing protein [Thiocapsa bogorovii]
MEQMMSESEDAIVRTKKWISEVVIGCRLCPFAAREFNRGAIHYQVGDASDQESCLKAFFSECRRLDTTPSIETTLLILPGAFPDFEAYLDLVALAEGLLEAEGYEGHYQVAGFHPDYRFADAPADDPANYTNRSPYPMLHLLREESIESVLQHYPDPDGIPERNIAFARQKGLEYMKALRDACL